MKNKEALKPSTIASAANKRGVSSRYLKELVGKGNAARRAGEQGGTAAAAWRDTSSPVLKTQAQGQTYVEGKMKKLVEKGVGMPKPKPAPNPALQPRFGKTLQEARMGKAASMNKEALKASTVASAAAKRGVSSDYLKELVARAGHRRRYFKATHRNGPTGGLAGAARQHTSWTWPDGEKKTMANNYIASKKKTASIDKEAVGNLGEEELNFLKKVRLTREDTRRDANALFSSSHQNRKRDQALLEKLFVQFPGAQTMSDTLLKQASTEQWDEYERIRTAYNVYHYFDSGAHLDSAQRNFPEILKTAKMRPVVTPKKVVGGAAPTGTTAASSTMSGANV